MRPVSFVILFAAALCACTNLSTDSGAGRDDVLTLENSGRKAIKNPTKFDIRTAVFGLDTSKGPAFLILSRGELTYIQASGDGNVGFNLEYQENDLNHHYRATRSDLSEEEIIHAFTEYARGSRSWKDVSRWSRMTL